MPQDNLILISAPHLTLPNTPVEMIKRTVFNANGRYPTEYLVWHHARGVRINKRFEHTLAGLEAAEAYFSQLTGLDIPKKD